MLTTIEINNFKSFDEKFIFNLNDVKSFDFNKECTRNGIINKALIYGQNACGKSNLGFAIFDLVFHLTNKRDIGSQFYENYQNANSNSNLTTFKFEFKFKDNKVKYEYNKKNLRQVESEKLTINDKEFAHIDKTESFFFTSNAKGVETLSKDMEDSPELSIIRYIDNSTVLEKKDQNNKIFKEFMNFVSNMLYFRSLGENNYIGFTEHPFGIYDYIIKNNLLKEFNDFLNEAGISCNLKEKKTDAKAEICFSFKNKEIDFFKIASSGTTSLALFYVWFQELKNNKDLKFVFIDEFDAFYHFRLSKLIISKLKEITNTQIILTTHNTSLLSNDLLRPDCYFLMYPNKIKSLSDSTDKELREAHNIEKMYKAGAFA